MRGGARRGHATTWVVFDAVRDEYLPAKTDLENLDEVNYDAINVKSAFQTSEQTTETLY